MSNPHPDRLARTDDLGVVHSYGYGALAELLRLVDEGLVDPAQFEKRWKQVVAAVEFRSAELKAVVLQEELGLSVGPDRIIHVHPPMPLTPIYVSDETPDEPSNLD